MSFDQIEGSAHMELKTEDGIDILILPGHARCMREFRNPMNMDECPLHCFDDEGKICVPELCEYYTESWKRK